MTRTIHTKVKFHESHFFSLLLFFFLYFPILFFSEKLTLTENSSSPLFSLFLLFSELVSHDVECFYCCNITENGRSMLTERLESNDGDQNNEKRVQFVLSTEKDLLFFFPITKRIEKARYSSKSFTELILSRSSSL